MLSTIAKWGNSKGVRIPRKILQEAGFENVHDIEITAKANVIEIRKVKPKITLADIFEGYNGSKASEEEGFGESVGREVW